MKLSNCLKNKSFTKHILQTLKMSVQNKFDNKIIGGHFYPIR